MKKLLLITILLCSLNTFSNGQWYNKYYPEKQLSELTSEELSFLLNKSINLRNAGILLTITGLVPMIIVDGYVLIILFFDFIMKVGDLDKGLSTKNYLFLGAVTIAAGVPFSLGTHMWKMGKQHKMEISRHMNNIKPDLSFKISPILQKNNINNKYGAGIYVSLSF